jgi:hypothetical protein
LTVQVFISYARDDDVAPPHGPAVVVPPVTRFVTGERLETLPPITILWFAHTAVGAS